MSNRIVVLDVDDNMLALNDHVCTKVGVDKSKIVDYHLGDCPELTKAECDLLFSEYHKVENFRIPFEAGVSEILGIKGYDFRVDSNCLTSEVMYYKYLRLKELGFIDSKITLSIIGKGEVREKAGSDVYILSDDSPYNVKKSNAQINLMIKQPWNQSDIGRELVKGKKVIYFNTFADEVDWLIKH